MSLLWRNDYKGIRKNTLPHMTLIDKVEQTQLNQDLKVDQFISRELAPIYVQQTLRIHRQGEMLGLSLRETGKMSRDRLRRLMNFELLTFTIKSAIQIVSTHMVNQLEVEQEIYLLQGFADAEEWADEQGINPGGAVFSLPANMNVFDQGMFTVRWESLGSSIAESLESHLMNTLPGARNPEDIIEREVDRALGAGMVWGIGMTSMSLWSFYRTGIQRFNAATGIKGWFWKALLDLKTCPSCVALHGTWHPASESLNDHPRGRCVPIPAPEGNWPGETGEEWFKKLSPSDQSTILGGAKFRAYESGDIQVSDFSQESINPVYGSIRRAASLVEILGPRASDFYSK